MVIRVSGARFPHQQITSSTVRRPKRSPRALHNRVYCRHHRRSEVKASRGFCYLFSSINLCLHLRGYTIYMVCVCVWVYHLFTSGENNIYIYIKPPIHLSNVCADRRRTSRGEINVIWQSAAVAFEFYHPPRDRIYNSIITPARARINGEGLTSQYGRIYVIVRRNASTDSRTLLSRTPRG